MKYTVSALLVPLVFSVACAATATFDDQPVPRDTTFGEAAPTAEALDRYETARDYAEGYGAVEMLVIEGNDVVFEWTHADYDRDTPRHLYSGTKSFSCAFAALMIDDGTLDLDESVTDTIPELAAGDAVQARHLLDFTSGIEQRVALSIDSTRENQRIEDKHAYAVALPGQWTPGSKYQYGPSHQMVLGELVLRKTGEEALTLLDERVFGPIGMSYGGWQADGVGHPLLPQGAWTTAWEWAKYGVLMRDDGMWQGERVLPEGTRELCTTGSEANPAYGLTWWLNGPVGEDADLGGINTIGNDDRPIMHADGYPDLFAAAGHKHQRLFVVPSLDLVVVMLADGKSGYEDRELLARLLPAVD